MENFFHLLKVKCIYGVCFNNREITRTTVFNYSSAIITAGVDIVFVVDSAWSILKPRLLLELGLHYGGKITYQKSVLVAR
ncbi:IS3 family transposase [Pectobacterium polaris]|uniref:IS3 family transposase n=1 Tax=Pectobacterium polaris TaxID=2042057 RepID=UPI00384F68AE